MPWWTILSSVRSCHILSTALSLTAKVCGRVNWKQPRFFILSVQIQRLRITCLVWTVSQRRTKNSSDKTAFLSQQYKPIPFLINMTSIRYWSSHDQRNARTISFSSVAKALMMLEFYQGAGIRCELAQWDFFSLPWSLGAVGLSVTLLSKAWMKPWTSVMHNYAKLTISMPV